MELIVLRDTPTNSASSACERRCSSRACFRLFLKISVSSFSFANPHKLIKYKVIIAINAKQNKAPTIILNLFFVLANEKKLFLSFRLLDRISSFFISFLLSLLSGVDRLVYKRRHARSPPYLLLPASAYYFPNDTREDQDDK